MKHATNFKCEECDTEISMGQQLGRRKTARILCLKCFRKLKGDDRLQNPTSRTRMANKGN